MPRPALLSAMAAAILLAGCGDIPQPFRHDGPARPLARPKMTRGVAVRPPASPEGDILAQALVRALEEQEVPALVQTGPAFGYQIEGRVDDLGPVLDVFWDLKTPDGETAAQSRQSVPKRLLDPAEAKPLARAADASAQLLALPLADPDALPDPARRQAPVAETRPVVRLTPLHGLPGDGGKALGEAMRRALERSGIAVAETGAAYVLEGRVTVAPGLANEDTVTVAWVLKHVQGGDEIANIGQSGAVPRGRLNLPWGALARDIAEGGASGVIQAVRADGNSAVRIQP